MVSWTSTGSFRALADSVPSPVLVTDGHGAAVYANRRLAAFTGLSEAELRGGGWRAVLHEDDREASAAARRRAIALAEPVAVECRIRAQAGDYRRFELWWAPVGADGPVDHCVGTATEVGGGGSGPGPRPAEHAAELRRLNDRLSLEIRRREAIQAVLLRSQKLEALGQVTASVAHDFNNVLAAIMGGFSIIRSWSDDVRVTKMAAEGVKAAERGADLIRGLLGFAREHHMVPRRVELQPLFADLEPQLRHLVGGHIDLRVENAARFPAIQIDPGQLQAAITNLVVNARDAMPAGGGVTIHFEDVPADRAGRPKELGYAEAVAIHVTDTGEGMPPAVLQRVLEPFFTTKGPGKGTGLGLAMAQGLMLQSGGALRIESQAGRGTTVSLYAPTSTQPANTTHGCGADAARAHGGGRILIVEPDGPVGAVITAQLSDWGYDVVKAEDADAALRIVRADEPPAFVITDHARDGADGVRLAAEVRALRPGLPILFLAGQPDLEGLDHEAVLLKPFAMTALADALLDLGERVHQWREAEAALDRLASRFKSDRMGRLLSSWRARRVRGELPPREQVTVPARDVDHVAHVVVDQAHVPMTFELVGVGADLAARAGAALAEPRLDVVGDDAETSQEGAYRRCVKSRRPTYEFARFGLGAEGSSVFERLLPPCSEDGADVTSLIAVVEFDDDLVAARCER